MRVPELFEKDMVRVVQAVRELAEGSTNAGGGAIALNPSSTTTTVSAPLCTANSIIVLVPLTQNAATAVRWIASVGNGLFTIGHDSTAAVDRTFKYEIRRGPG